MKRAYLAGPMTGIPEFNYPAFMEGARLLRERGWEILNPAEMDKVSDNFDYAGVPLDKQGDYLTNETIRRFAHRDLMAILTLHAENGDAIIVLPGWEQSTGAGAETALAKWIRLPRYTLDEALERGGY